MGGEWCMFAYLAWFEDWMSTAKWNTLSKSIPVATCIREQKTVSLDFNLKLSTGGIYAEGHDGGLGTEEKHIASHLSSLPQIKCCLIPGNENIKPLDFFSLPNGLQSRLKDIIKGERQRSCRGIIRLRRAFWLGRHGETDFAFSLN